MNLSVIILFCHFPLYLDFYYRYLTLHKLSGGKMGDYCDGELFLNHPLFQEDPSALQIRLYYDDLEVCNALGSKTKKHKLGRL